MSVSVELRQMRYRLLCIAFVLLLSALPSAAVAQSGGSQAPSSQNGGSAGGTQYGPGAAKRAHRQRAPKLWLTPAVFSISPGKVPLDGNSAKFRYRIDGPARTVRVRIELRREGSKKRIRLGFKHTGKTYTYNWNAAPTKIKPGSYTALIHAVNPHNGERLKRNTKTSGRVRLRVIKPPPAPEPTPLPPTTPQALPPPTIPLPGNTPGVFPVQGPYTLGDGFGVSRPGHTHQGVDVLAVEGLPIVAPRAGTIVWRKHQEQGAGYYLVLRAQEGRDYIFMHLKPGSILVSVGDHVASGQKIAEVGSSGTTSGAQHLHFEIWPNGWYSSKTSQPMDPLPDLKAWAKT